MASHDDHAPAPAAVPANMLERHRHGWNTFTKATTRGCIALAVLLLLMLVFLVIY